MRKPLVALAATLLVASAAFAMLPASALAGSGPAAGGSPGATAGVGLPVYGVRSTSWRPPGFSSNAAEAIKATEDNQQMLAIHAREHPLHVIPRVWIGTSWLIDFYYRGKLAAEAVVSRAGRVTGVWTGPLAQTLYARGNFATRFGAWWVLVPFALLFLLPFLDVRRPFRLAHLDALVVLSFLVSYFCSTTPCSSPRCGLPINRCCTCSRGCCGSAGCGASGREPSPRFGFRAPRA